MKLTVRVLESDKIISERIGNALIPQVRKFMEIRKNKLREQLPSIIYKAIVSSPEYSSILGGGLRYQFGIPNPMQKLEGILNIWVSNVLVTYTPPVVISGGRIKSGIIIEMIKSDYSDVLGTDYALVEDKRRGYSLPWLKWLLLDGSYTLVRNHQVILGSNPRSRTGLAVMRPSSDSWGVPRRFSGTMNDNWITRSLDLSQNVINNFIIKVMENG